MANISIKLYDFSKKEESESGDRALFINGEFVSSYNGSVTQNHRSFMIIMKSMMSDAYEAGKKARSKEISDLLIYE